MTLYSNIPGGLGEGREVKRRTMMSARSTYHVRAREVLELRRKGVNEVELGIAEAELQLAHREYNRTRSEFNESFRGRT